MPWLYVNSILGRVNLKEWCGFEKETWLCVSARYKVLASTWSYLSLQFQHREGGWQPTVIFHDERTQTPPSDLVKDVGYRTISYYRTVDFEQILKTLVVMG